MQLKEIELALQDFTKHGAPWTVKEMEKCFRAHDDKGFCTNKHGECDEEKCDCNEEPSDEPLVREGEPLSADNNQPE